MTDETMNHGGDADSMSDLLSQQEYSFEQPKRGDTRVGTVVWMGPNEIVVDIGVKREGIINSRDLDRLSPEELAEISVGSEIPVYIVKPEDQDGNLVVSIYLAQIELAWQEAKQYLDERKIYETKVSGFNKGGLVAPFGNLRGFVPASQVVGLPRRLSEEDRIERLSEQVERDIVVQVIEVDRRRKRLVMSEVAAQRQWREQRRRELIDTLAEGQEVHGVVRSLANFGAFVDLGGVDGLVHISEFSWQSVRHPSQVVRVGEEVDVYVLNLDREQGKIGLSIRRLLPDPWTVIADEYAVGQRVSGVITNIVDFGAFVRLENGVEGLVHVSELSEADVGHPSEIVRRGQRCLLEIIKIDPDRRRIGLSLRRVPPHEQEPEFYQGGEEPERVVAEVEAATVQVEEPEPEVVEAEMATVQVEEPEPEVVEAEMATVQVEEPEPEVVEAETAVIQVEEPDLAVVEAEMATVSVEEPEPEVVEAETATPAMSGTEKPGPAAAQTDELESPIDETAVPAPAVPEIASPELPLFSVGGGRGDGG